MMYEIEAVKKYEKQLKNDLYDINTFFKYINKVVNQYDAQIITHRYLYGESWQEIAVGMTAMCSNEAVRKIAEREIDKYNRLIEKDYPPTP